MPPSSDEFWIPLRQMLFDAELYTEAFYYFAFRVYCIAREGLVPGLTAFRCDGVRDVRNHLIEHPDGRSSLVAIQGFGGGGDSGPVLKPGRYEHQVGLWEDRGLFVNAREFKEGLEKSLMTAIANAPQ